MLARFHAGLFCAAALAGLLLSPRARAQNQQPGAAAVQDASPSAPEARRPGELWLGLGLGNAVCDNKKPDSQCPVNGALTLDLGGAWRFHPHWAVGGDFALWSFKVRDAWRGQLTDPATDVTLTSYYFAPFMRWYWFGHGVTDAYLQGGIGYGALTAKASNSSGSYSATSSGMVYPFAIGAEWHIGRIFRLGPQLLAYALISHRVCETTNGKQSCRDGGKNDNALPWRLMLMGSFMFGKR